MSGEFAAVGKHSHHSLVKRSYNDGKRRYCGI